MVTLTKIRKDENFIETFYYPEDSKEAGYIKVDKNGVVIEKKISASDNREKYYYHALRGLLKYTGQEDVPETTTVMWY